MMRRGEEVSQRHLVIISRADILVLVGIAVYFALASGQLVFWLVLFAWAGLGAAFRSVLILSLFWRGMTKAGALAGMIGGTVITFVWKLIPALSNALCELIPASIGAALIAVAVSSFTEAPSDARTILDAIAARYHRSRKRSR